MTAAEDVPIGRRLYEAGWRQGASLLVNPDQFAFLSHDCVTEAGDPLNRRAVKQAERLIIVSQDCDVVAAEADEPCIEAFVCTRENARRRSQIAFNSRRYFVLDDNPGFVARAAYRVFIRKRLAITLDPPEKWPYGEMRGRRFIRWLGDRYTRPPLPDVLVEDVQRPLIAALQAIEGADAARAALLSLVIPEIRITLPITDEPPFALRVLVILEQAETLDSEQVEDLNEALTVLEAALLANLTSTNLRYEGVKITTEADLSVAEFRATAPIYYESLTYGGDEAAGGAEPINVQ